MTVNAGLIKAAGNMILAFPESWNQRQWCQNTGESTNGCGTTYCLAGWVARLTGYIKADGTFTKKGRKFAKDGGYLCYEEETSRQNAGMGNAGWVVLGARELGLPVDLAEELFLAGTGSSDYEVDSPEAMMDVIHQLTGVRVNPPLPDNYPQDSPLNVAFLRAVVGMIEAYPANYNQGTWANNITGDTPSTLCGTSFCLAGWATTMSGVTKLDGRLSKQFKEQVKIELANGASGSKVENPKSLLDGFWRRDLRSILEGNEEMKGHPDVSAGDFMPGMLWAQVGANLLGLRSDTHIFGGGYGANTVQSLKASLFNDFRVTF